MLKLDLRALTSTRIEIPLAARPITPKSRSFPEGISGGAKSRRMPSTYFYQENRSGKAKGDQETTTISRLGVAVYPTFMRVTIFCHICIALRSKYGKISAVIDLLSEFIWTHAE